MAAAGSNMTLSVYDLEATRVFTLDRWSFLAAGGLRYAHLNQNFSVSLADAGVNVGTETASHNFNGFGPTLALEARRQLGDTDFGLYGTARGVAVVRHLGPD